MEFDKNKLKQNDLLIDLLVDNLIIDGNNIRIENIVPIKKVISNTSIMNRILEDSKKLNKVVYKRKNEILLFLLGKAKELNYDFSSYNFPNSRNSYYTLDLSNAEKIIEEKLLAANSSESKLDIIKDFYNGILEQQISSYTNIIKRKLDDIIPCSESQKRINAILDELDNNNVDANDYNNLDEYATALNAAMKKDRDLFSQMFDEMNNEYKRVAEELNLPSKDE